MGLPAQLAVQGRNLSPRSAVGPITYMPVRTPVIAYGTDAMILLTRLNGDEIYLNPDLIERIEAAPDTIVSLVDGKKYVAVEDPHELISRIVAFRAAVLVAAEAEAQAGETHTSSFGALTPPRPLRLIEDHTSE
jgi:flagellar protein FlbD